MISRGYGEWDATSHYQQATGCDSFYGWPRSTGSGSRRPTRVTTAPLKSDVSHRIICSPWIRCFTRPTRNQQKPVWNELFAAGCHINECLSSPVAVHHIPQSCAQSHDCWPWRCVRQPGHRSRARVCARLITSHPDKTPRARLSSRTHQSYCNVKSKTKAVDLTSEHTNTITNRQLDFYFFQKWNVHVLFSTRTSWKIKSRRL